MLFLQDMRQQDLLSAGGKDLAVGVDPNSCFSDKLWILFNDIGADFYHNMWCTEYMTGGEMFPHRHIYFHGTGQFCALGDQLTRYFQFMQIVGDAF